jgi:hypothetical protein
MPDEKSRRTYSYIVLLFLITFILRIILIGYYHNNLGGIEPNVIYGVQRILSGQPLYQDPSAGSYAIIQYTPLYYHLVAWVAKRAGIDALNVQGIYVVCRLLALIFNLLTVLCCALIIRSWRIGWRMAIIFAMPVLMLLTSHYYTRGDSVHLFFFCSAFYVYLSQADKRRIYLLPIAALLTALCIMVKQSGILLPGVIAFCLLFIERKVLRALFYVACSLLFSWIIAALFTHGDWLPFYRNTYLGLRDSLDFSFLYNIFISPFFRDMVPCYLLGGLIVYFSLRQIEDKRFRIIAAAAAWSFLFAVLTGLKKSSSNNYFTEFLVFVVLAIPFLLQSPSAGKVLLTLRGRPVTVRRFALIALLILVTSKTIGLFTAVFFENSFKSQHSEYVNEQLLYRYFKDELKIQPGERIFFTERRFLDNVFFEYAVMPTKDVVTQVYIAMPLTYDYSSFTAGMNTGLVNYIVTDEKRDNLNACNDSLPFILFDKSKFRLVARVYGYCIYRYAS